jgi:antitoxin component of MazEF toxin-antitoxin module
MATKIVKLRKRGNGLWITIPAAIVKERNLKPGDEAQITQTGEHEFELGRVCSQTGAIEKILTLSCFAPSNFVAYRNKINEE